MYTTWLRCLAMWISILFPAVSQPILVGPDRLLDANARTEITQELTRQLNAQYVFPKVAAQIEQVIQTHLAAGDYDQITSSKVFADTITAQMRRISHDKHLRLFYQNKRIPPTNSERTIKADEEAALKQYGRQINFGFGQPERLAGNIGYLRVDEFMPVELAVKTATDAMAYLNQTDALILDLRQNRGGEPALVAYLASYFFGPDSVHLNDIVRKGGDAVQSFWTRSQISGKRYLEKSLYILTSKKTFSAGEEFAYDLQSLKRALIVGEPTAGGAHAGEQVRISDHFTAFIPVEYARNPITHTNWEGAGVQPDLATTGDQALRRAQIAALETLISSTYDIRKKRELAKLIKQLTAVD